MESPIQKLSDDVLLEVFEFLDGKSLKKAALVCKNWNDVISLSPSTMKKFTLKVSNLNVTNANALWEERLEEVLSLERKFQAIDVTLLFDPNIKTPSVFDLRVKNATESLIKIAMCHGSQIRKMILRNFKFDDVQDFSDVFTNFPLIEDLEFRDVSFKQPEKREEIVPLVMKELKTLKLNGSSWRIFQHLIGTQVTSLAIFSARTFIIKSERENFINFMKASKNLESIEFDYPSFCKTFEGFSEFPSKLKKVKILSYQQNFEDEVEENFKKFLISQASSLEELEFNIVSAKTIDTIFTQLKCLKKLRINASSLPTNQSFYDQFKAVRSLVEIHAHDELLNETAAKALFGLLPNLEVIKVDHDPNGIVSRLLPFIATYNPRLKSLSIDSLEVQPDVKFKHLKMFGVKRIENFEFLLEFLSLNEEVDTLSIENSKKFVINDEVLEALMEKTNLSHLKFFGDYETIESIYNKIKLDYKKLKSIELVLKVGFEGFEGRGTKLSFWFPSDPSKWDPKCSFFD